jgi:RND family efflux transporter MFP subunit
MKNIKFLLFAGIIAGFAACTSQIQNEQADLAIPISVEDVKNQSIQQYINTTGTAKATSETTLSTETAGDYKLAINPATGRPFKLGDRVKAGQVIVRLEDKEYEIGIALETKKLNLEISDQEYEKQKSLYEKGGVTLRELRNSEVSKINAQNDYESAMLKLEKMSVVAPISGVIVDLPYYTPGTKINSGQSVVSLMSYEKMYMDFNLPEKTISDIQLGQQVLVTSYTLENDTLMGIISELSPAISTETRTFKGKLTIDNPKLLLRPGMFVKADIITASKDSTIVIPKDIILSSNRGKSVYVVDRSNARERRITLGIENQDYVEVIDGLSVNDQLVVKGYETLRNGSKVKVIR